MSTITLAVSPVTAVAETSVTPITFTFTRTAPFTTPLANTLAVNYTVRGTATPGADYTGTPAGAVKTVAFGANSATATVVVDPSTDDIAELTESVILTVVAGANYTVGTPSTATANIGNSGTTTPVITLTASPAAVDSDSPATLVYTFTRTGTLTAPLTVLFEAGGTAIAGVNYQPIPSYVTFEAGAATVKLVVEPIADEFTLDRTFSIKVLAPIYATDSHDPIETTISQPDPATLLIDPNGATQLTMDKTTGQVSVVISGTPTAVMFRTGEPLEPSLFVARQLLAAEIIGGVRQLLWLNLATNYVYTWVMTSTWTLDTSAARASEFRYDAAGIALQAQFGITQLPVPI